MKARRGRSAETISPSARIRSASIPTRPTRLRSRRRFARRSVPISPRAEPARQQSKQSHYEEPMATQQIFSPLPGIFYRKPAPDKPVYKDDGDVVADSDTIGLIEVMKSFNEVKAGAAGKIVRFLAENE